MKALILIFVLALSQSAIASTGENYGYGSRASAMGNTMLSGANGGFATFYNPAATSANPGLQIGIATAFAHPSFTEIKSVTIANNATTAQPGDVIGNVDTEGYLDHLGQAVGASLNLGERFKHLTLGFVASMPLARVAYLDSGEPFKPEYFNYRARTQRPQIYASLGLTPLENLHVATGIAIATNMSGSFTAFATGAANSVSYQRIATTLKPSAAPYFSVYADPKPWLAGLTVRLPNRYKIDLDTTANARLLGPTNDLPLVINSSGSLFYDPLEVDLGAAYQVTNDLWATLEVDWFQYKAFEPPTLKVVDLGSVSKLQNSIDTTPSMQNIFVPKIGIEYVIEPLKLRAGYLYRSSPVKDNSGPGNLVDPAKHVISAGVGFDLKKVGVTEKEITLDLHAQYHHLARQHIDKSPNNEVGTSGQSKVGAPGYDIGGRVLGAGLSLSMAF